MLFVTGKACDKLIDNLLFCTDVVAWSESIKYLGIHFYYGCTLDIDISHMMRKFYAAANAICGHVKFASDMSRLLLMESFCLPLLSYCCEAMQYSRRQLQQLNVCWNNAYRKVSGMHSWASVKEIQFYCGGLDFIHTYVLRKLTFLSK